jgi:hypothetical protein
MMFRLSIALGLAAALGLMTSTADAADPSSDSNVSQSSLAAMGLGGMRAMDRQESSQIRGQGAVVFGVSWARSRVRTGNDVFRSGSINGYRARFPSFAGGGSLSLAGTSVSPIVYGAGLSIAGGF